MIVVLITPPTFHQKPKPGTNKAARWLAGTKCRSRTNGVDFQAMEIPAGGGGRGREVRRRVM